MDISLSLELREVERTHTDASPSFRNVRTCLALHTCDQTSPSANLLKQAGNPPPNKLSNDKYVNMVGICIRMYSGRAHLCMLIILERTLHSYSTASHKKSFYKLSPYSVLLRMSVSPQYSLNILLRMPQP